MICLFKLWCNQRLTKAAVLSEPTVSSVIREASKILHLNGTHLV